MSYLKKQSMVDNYTVQFQIAQCEYAEIYRVKDNAGKKYFLKLINLSKLQHSQFDSNGNVLEIEILKQLNHRNICKYHSSGEYIINCQKMVYCTMDFISGETVSQKIAREGKSSVYEAKQIILGALNGLRYIHNLPKPIIHNDMTPSSVMLDMSGEQLSVKIFDFGHALYINQGQKALRFEELSPFYMASEAFNGIFTPQSDLFSVGVMLYKLVYGSIPNYIDISKYKGDRDAIIDAILAHRKMPVCSMDREIVGLDDNLIEIMSKALSPDVDKRFKTADEFINELNKISCVNVPDTMEKRQASKHITKRIGNGFADIAGMQQLKEQLKYDVIDLFEHPEENAKLGIPMPNGLLFYGPPGCGKTFFAEKFAEEMGCNYMYIKCSDVASPYIHGGQEKIANIFDQARANAPSILFFDEIEAMITDRSKQTNVSEAGEVNEFLAQLNRCGESGVLVIGATNKPSIIDTAALRAGRLEQKIYIPVPDLETRKEMLMLYLSKRSDFGIDYDTLAKCTENYVSSDIKLLTDNAARMARRQKLDKITMEVLKQAIAVFKPTVSLEEIKKHEAIRDKFEGSSIPIKERQKIGFK